MGISEKGISLCIWNSTAGEPQPGHKAPRPDLRDSDELTEAAREVPQFCNGVATTLTAYT